MTIAWPLIHAPARDARKTAAPAMSSGSPSRPNGELEAIDFSLARIVEAACAPLSEFASQKSVALEIELGEDSLDRCGDPGRVQQVITSLVSNAVKFTEAGRVTVRAEASEAAVTLVVADTGIGIPPDRVDELFQKFVQMEASTTRRFGGSGLGLAICRQLVELMGGSIAVTSALQVGSTFVVRLPLKAAVCATAPSETAPAGIVARRPRILAAEDNPTNRLILNSLLEPMDVDLTLVANGQEAVEAFVDARFDVVLMDIQMPLMDGRRGRSQGNPQGGASQRGSSDPDCGPVRQRDGTPGRGISGGGNGRHAQQAVHG
jgi:CheY-like chemotaxis protein